MSDELPRLLPLDIAPDLPAQQQELVAALQQSPQLERITEVVFDLLAKTAELSTMLLESNAMIQGLVRRTADDHQKIHQLEGQLQRLEQAVARLPTLAGPSSPLRSTIDDVWARGWGELRK